MVVDWGPDERVLTERVSVLVGERNGNYPSGNTLLVRGEGETVVIDPSIELTRRGGAPSPVDAVINSHAHEDHMAGNHLYPDARVHLHHLDVPGAQSLDGLLDVYGIEPERRAALGSHLVERFDFAPRPDAIGFGDGHVFDLGGVEIEAVHLPGHTRGHSGFRVSTGVFFLSDIDLTGFGPYYGDAWSDLDDFEQSLVEVRDEHADFYVTFHQRGVIEGREHFLELLDAFASVIPRRHDAMLRFLAEPRTVDDMVEHRFIYRPHVDLIFVPMVERRSAELHLQRMLRRGEAVEVEPGRYRAA